MTRENGKHRESDSNYEAADIWTTVCSVSYHMRIPKFAPWTPPLPSSTPPAVASQDSSVQKGMCPPAPNRAVTTPRWWGGGTPAGCGRGGTADGYCSSAWVTDTCKAWGHQGRRCSQDGQELNPLVTICLILELGMVAPHGKGKTSLQNCSGLRVLQDDLEQHCPTNRPQQRLSYISALSNMMVTSYTCGWYFRCNWCHQKSKIKTILIDFNFNSHMRLP